MRIICKKIIAEYLPENPSHQALGNFHAFYFFYQENLVCEAVGHSNHQEKS